MMADQIPVSRLSRSRVVAAAVLKAGGKQLGHMSKRTFMSTPQIEHDKQRLDDATARLAFETFTKLRGTALKIAQMLSMETSMLPESFRKELSKSYHQVPPLGRTLVRKIFLQEFDKTAEQLFCSFDSGAFAAASLGQVHVACNDNGDSLAVKLQYPGIDVTIDNDLKMVRTVLKRSQHAKLLTTSLDEVELRLREEVDYYSEADNTEWFRAHLKVEGVVIPKVYRQFSSKKVLTTQHLQGQHLEEWLQSNPSQEQRNKFAQLLYDTFVHSFYGLHALHADPNPGNYLFCADQQLGLLDFGCVRHFSPRFTELMPKLMRAYQDENAKIIMDLYADIGILSSIPEEQIQVFYDDYLKPFGDWITQPFKTEAYDFGNQKKPSAGDALKSVSHMAANTSFDSMANEFIFFNRTYFGICNIFERMHATVRMHHQWLQTDPASQTADGMNQ